MAEGKTGTLFLQLLSRIFRVLYYKIEIETLLEDVPPRVYFFRSRYVGRVKLKEIKVLLQAVSLNYQRSNRLGAITGQRLLVSRFFRRAAAS